MKQHGHGLGMRRTKFGHFSVYWLELLGHTCTRGYERLRPNTHSQLIPRETFFQIAHTFQRQRGRNGAASVEWKRFVRAIPTFLGVSPRQLHNCRAIWWRFAPESLLIWYRSRFDAWNASNQLIITNHSQSAWAILWERSQSLRSSDSTDKPCRPLRTKSVERKIWHHVPLEWENTDVINEWVKDMHEMSYIKAEERLYSGNEFSINGVYYAGESSIHMINNIKQCNLRWC